MINARYEKSILLSEQARAMQAEHSIRLSVHPSVHSSIRSPRLRLPPREFTLLPRTRATRVLFPSSSPSLSLYLFFSPFCSPSPGPSFPLVSPPGRFDTRSVGAYGGPSVMDTPTFDISVIDQ